MKVVLALMILTVNTFASEWNIAKGRQEGVNHFLSNYRGMVKLYNCDIYIDHIGDDNRTVWLTLVDRVRGNNAALSMVVDDLGEEVSSHLLMTKISGQEVFRKTDSLSIKFDSDNFLEKLEYRSIMSKPFKVLNSIKCEK